eukprot:SAG31_NODE_12158_length_963_cov_1.466435_1_plen_203_part_10
MFAEPDGAPDCLECAGNSIPDLETGSSSCRDCVPGRAPDITRTRCVCAGGYYNSTLSPVQCYEGTQRYKPNDAENAMVLSQQQCAPCGETHPCISCRPDAEGFPTPTTVLPGYALSPKGLQAASFASVVGQRAVYRCPIAERDGVHPCTGDMVSPCADGYTGPLCAVCAEGYSRAGLIGHCDECSGAMSIIWVVLAGILAISF